MTPHGFHGVRVAAAAALKIIVIVIAVVASSHYCGDVIVLEDFIRIVVVFGVVAGIGTVRSPHK